MDTHTLVDIASLVVAVAGSYLASVRGLEQRITKLERTVAVLIDRDRRKRLEDYASKETSDDDAIV